MSSKRRFKFVSPYVSQATDISCEPTTSKNVTYLAAEISTDEIATQSTGISVSNLIESGLKSNESLSGMKGNILKAQAHFSAAHFRQHISLKRTRTTSNASSLDPPHAINLADGSTMEHSAYVFPTSPVKTERNRPKQMAVKQAKKKSDKRLLEYIMSTLKEIKEIRMKRKILREKGLEAFKKYKASFSR